MDSFFYAGRIVRAMTGAAGSNPLRNNNLSQQPPRITGCQDQETNLLVSSNIIIFHFSMKTSKIMEIHKKSVRGFYSHEWRDLRFEDLFHDTWANREGLGSKDEND